MADPHEHVLVVLRIIDCGQEFQVSSDPSPIQQLGLANFCVCTSSWAASSASVLSRRNIFSATRALNTAKQMRLGLSIGPAISVGGN